MPTYAILGVTVICHKPLLLHRKNLNTEFGILPGSTGSSLLRYLRERPEKVNIRLYARSASKVDSLHPYVKTAQNIQSFVGDLSNTDVLKNCLRDVDVIFSAVAQNNNEPGCSIAQRTAHSIVSALEALRKEKGSTFNPPILVFLSSASLNPTFSEATPRLLHWVLERGCFHVYDDLRKSIEYLNQQSWIPLMTAQPPALTNDISRGYELSLEQVTPAVSYDDLARGMVRMAEEEGGHKWVGKGVGIKATGKVKMSYLPLIWYLVVGLISYYSPATWGVLQRAGLNP